MTMSMKYVFIQQILLGFIWLTRWSTWQTEYYRICDVVFLRWRCRGRPKNISIH